MTQSNKRGVLGWFHEDTFADGGVVETAIVEPTGLPFQISQWDVAPGRRNDLDVHRSTEVWLIAEGSGVLTLDGVDSRLHAGDAVVFCSGVPHQLDNDGRVRFRAVSVYWLEAANVGSASDQQTAPSDAP